MALAGKRCVIIGAGVIGNACAFHLAKQLKSTAEVYVLEKASSFGTETSARNSEVIHAGIYYPMNSLKAKFCVNGSRLLYDFLKVYNIPHQKCGKLLVASNEKDEIKLKQLQSRAIDNGVTSLKSLTKEDVRLLEPDVECHSAILSPNTGIFDSYQFQSTLEYQASESGVSYIYNCEVTGIQVWSSSHKSINKKSVYIHNSEPSFTVHTSQGSFDCDVLINATGLWSISMASKLQFNKDLFDLSDRYLQHLPSSCYFAKGNYFKLTSSVKPFHHLIYPVPADDIAGLGIHATIDLNGCVRFGPDIEWLKNKNDDYAFSPHEKMSFDYNVNENRKNDFIHAIQRYFPNISIYDIETDYSGIRPKLCGPNGSTTTSPTSTTSTTPISTDFQIMTKSEHGIPRLINILGIESPGLTSSLAMAEYICDKLLSNSKK